MIHTSSQCLMLSQFPACRDNKCSLSQFTRECTPRCQWKLLNHSMWSLLIRMDMRSTILGELWPWPWRMVRMLELFSLKLAVSSSATTPTIRYLSWPQRLFTMASWSLWPFLKNVILLCSRTLFARPNTHSKRLVSIRIARLMDKELRSLFKKAILMQENVLPWVKESGLSSLKSRTHHQQHQLNPTKLK